MDAALEKNEVVITKPTSDEEFHKQTAQKIAEHSTVAGHPTTEETVRGGKVLTITPDMEQLGLKPAGAEISAGDVIRSIQEEFEDATEGTHRVGQGKSLGPLRLEIRRIVNKLNLKKAA